MESEGGFHAAFLQTRSGPDGFSAGILERRPSMSRQLKKMLLPGGVNATEKACGDYVCKYCGGRATACNFVANMCLQVYARHQGLCGAYKETETYMGYITECSTCEFQGVSGECLYEGKAAMG